MRKLPLVAALIVAACLSRGECLAHANRPSNVLLICVDDLRPELACFGKSHIHSPNIDQLAANGRLFKRHYVQAPTCGASRYALLTGRYGTSRNDALFIRANAINRGDDSITPSMPEWFRQRGYTTVSVGKVSHHPGGRGGANWDDSTIPEMPNAWDRHLLPAGAWQHPRGWMHGLANGEIRKNASDMDVMQSIEGPDSIYPDGGSVDEAIKQLGELTGDDAKPFFLAVGILRPHLPFGAPKKYLDLYKNTDFPPTPHPQKPTGKTTWHSSGEFMKYHRWGRNPNNDPEFALQLRRHYAACVSYADAQVGRILSALNSSSAGKDTVVVLWGDHGWHLGEHAIWGKHALFEESLHSPLVISFPGIQNAGQSSDAVVETLDLFPTLCDLVGLPVPGFVDGVSLTPWLQSPDHSGHLAVSYNPKGTTIRSDTHRMIVHRGGHVELYDHDSPEGETQNIAASHPELVAELKKRIEEKVSLAK